MFINGSFLAALAGRSYHWSQSGSPELVGAMVGWSVALCCVVCIAAITMRVMFALAAYNDAMAKGSSDATMWGLLIGFLGLIPGIIYLCVRSTQQRKVCCMRCGLWHNAFDPVCPRCGTPTPAAPQQFNPYIQVYEAKAKKFLIAAFICLGIIIVASIVGMAAIGSLAVSSAETFVSGDY